MPDTFSHPFHRLRGLAVLVLVAVLGACEDPIKPAIPETTELAVVLNSTGISLTVFPVDSPSLATTIGLAEDGSPVSLATRGATAVVPLGTYPYAAVVDLKAGAVEYTVPLPDSSGATGVAFVSDTLALVANPMRNTVTPVNVLRGTAGAEIAVGAYPHAIVSLGDTAFVLNAQLENWSPAREGTVTVIDGGTLEVLGTIQLSGLNPGAAAVGDDGRVYVVNGGTWGANNGAVSVIDPTSMTEVDFHEGFGDLPGTIAIDSDGVLYVGAYAYGIALWDTGTETFVRGPADAVAPVAPGDTTGSVAVSSLGFDSEGRLYATKPGNCTDPSVVLRLDRDFTVGREIQAGVCPWSIDFGATTDE